ncbi:MAG: hypothetical protein KBF37_08740 [Saprospiraceae bacterium]|jgi:hypothetical protein|nr:hypothetical protein [Saprospiraceae bacterium]MBP9210391.1 hypothetical protein [Saprospiraceae bacterium]MBV6472439.1 hypothetical protein [Saprospiraceae bacterium]
MKTTSIFSFNALVFWAVLSAPWTFSSHLSVSDPGRNECPGIAADHSDAAYSAIPVMVSSENRLLTDTAKTADVFEICYSFCGNPYVVINQPCWMHCRYYFWLRSSRVRK